MSSCGAGPSRLQAEVEAQGVVDGRHDLAAEHADPVADAFDRDRPHQFGLGRR